MSRRKRRPPDEVSAPWIYGIHDPTLPLGGTSDERLPGGDNRGDSQRRNTGEYVTNNEIMQAFDALSPSVRQALANAAQPWAPHWAEYACINYPESAIIERLQRADREEAQRRELSLLLGRG